MKYSTFERYCVEKLSNKTKDSIPDHIIKQALVDV